MLTAAIIKSLQVYGIAIVISMIVAVIIKLMVVLTARALDAGARFFMPDALQQEVIDGKARLNAFIASSVPRGSERVLPDASHSFMAAERADAVVAALRELLAQVTRA